MTARPQSGQMTHPRPSTGRTIGCNLRFASVLALALVLAGPLPAQMPFADIAAADRTLAGNAPAYRALQEGRVEDASALLHATLAANPSDALARQLLCRVAYAQDQADEAIGQCERAVADDPAN